MYDLFISHASEDKVDLVEPLVAALIKAGFRVWFDQDEIKLGDDFRVAMDAGLAAARFGVVVLSPSFEKYWPEAELSALFNQERVFDEKRILPIVHGLTMKEITRKWPLLGSRAMAHSSDGIDNLVARIAKAVRPRTAESTTAPDPAGGGSHVYDPWNPATPPRFVGRTRALRRLDDSLGDRNGVSIVGDGRIGKSSLLLTWRAKLHDSGRTVRYVDGQGKAGASERAFVTAITGAPAPDDVEGAADALAAWAANEPDGLSPVILVDELDHLPERFAHRFFERLRNLLGSIVLVVASRREVDLLYRDLGLTSPFESRLRLLRLGLLERPAAETLIRAGAPHLGEESFVLMRRWAGRHPLYLQLLGRCLIEADEVGDSRDDALDRFRDEAASRLRDLWQRLTDGDRESIARAARDEPVAASTLIRRGLLDRDGRPFGKVLTAWLGEDP